MTSPRQVAVGIPYCPATGRILLITSRNHKGMWMFPKGGIEKGETTAEAAVREAHEEAGTPIPTSQEDVSALLATLEPEAPPGKRSEEWHVHAIHISSEDALCANWLEAGQRERKWFTPDEVREAFEPWGSVMAAHHAQLDPDMSRGSKKKKAVKGDVLREALAAFVQAYAEKK